MVMTGLWIGNNKAIMIISKGYLLLYEGNIYACILNFIRVRRFFMHNDF